MYTKSELENGPFIYIVSCPGYGKTVSELENGHLEIVDFPIKNGDVP